MTHRFCTRCQAEVEDAGGFCLLGHSLRLEAATDSLSALRAEVNRTFDEAREQLHEVMAPAAAVAQVVVTPAPITRPEASPSPLPHPPAFVPTPPLVTLEDPPEIEVETPAEPDMVTKAPEPLTADAGVVAHHDHATVWDGLEDSPTLTPGDPIAAFAPSPRMDWGPKRTRRRHKRSSAPELQPEG
jgi:hypothetical protein